MKRLPKWAALGLALCLPLSAQAHRAWLLPSATVLSGTAPWITVDAAVSNDLFYFEHVPLLLQGIAPAHSSGDRPGRGPRSQQLQILAPDGSTAAPEHGQTGQLRTTFDLHLLQKGTYRLTASSSGLQAFWEENGQKRRWMGPAEALENAVPKQASQLKITRFDSRTETFVTSGPATDSALKPRNQGLELVPVTHPNDLFAGETATFAFLLDGQPAAGIGVQIIAGNERYRDDSSDIHLTTDAQGQIRVSWPQPGMYWLQAQAGRAGDPARPAVTEQRFSYTATLEVLAP